MDGLDAVSRLVLRLLVILDIAVLFLAITYLGTGAVVDRPAYPNFSEIMPLEESPASRAEYLESLRTMQATYKQDQTAFARAHFWIAMPLGLLAVALGLSRGLGEIGIGFVLAGLVTLVFTYCATREHYAVDAVSGAASLTALILLILIARRRLTKDM
jgi:hypothetical protein